MHAMTSVDGRLLRTLKCLLLRPGALTVTYLKGPRKPFVAPLQVFLFANVVFFAVQSFSSTNIFGATLESQLHDQDWSQFATSMVQKRLDNTHRGIETFAPVFDHAAALNAKALIIVMAVAFSVLLPLAFIRAKQTLTTHFVFSLHLYAFLLLLFSLSLSIAIVDVFLGGAGLQSARMDNVLSAINFIACGIYIYLAIGTVYGSTGPVKAVKALALTALAGALVLAYRFVIFLVTLYGT
jgi:hypothetical protein